jgi:hypothetical protein
MDYGVEFRRNGDSNYTYGGQALRGSGEGGGHVFLRSD